MKAALLKLYKAFEIFMAAIATVFIFSIGIMATCFVLAIGYMIVSPPYETALAVTSVVVAVILAAAALSRGWWWLAGIIRAIWRTVSF